jgi:hypothetical protein
MHHRKHMSCDNYLLLCDVIAYTENTASSIVAFWAVFTELLSGNVLIRSVTIHTYATNTHTQTHLKVQEAFRN